MSTFTMRSAATKAGFAVSFFAVCGISAALIGERMATPELRAKAACSLGLVEFGGNACVAQRIEAARAMVRDDLQNARKAQAAAEQALQGAIVYTQGPTVDNLTVIVGSVYEDHAGRQGLVHAVCFGFLDIVGLDPQLTLAKMGPDAIPEDLPVDAFQRSALNVEEATVAEAQDACPWPDADSTDAG
ncbi:MAG: hypothetical protein AAFY02_14230 [Pseudomonadota bacterium]